QRQVRPDDGQFISTGTEMHGISVSSQIKSATGRDVREGQGLPASNPSSGRTGEIEKGSGVRRQRSWSEGKGRRQEDRFGIGRPKVRHRQSGPVNVTEKAHQVDSRSSLEG